RARRVRNCVILTAGRASPTPAKGRRDFRRTGPRDGCRSQASRGEDGSTAEGGADLCDPVRPPARLLPPGSRGACPKLLSPAHRRPARGGGDPDLRSGRSGKNTGAVRSSTRPLTPRGNARGPAGGFSTPSAP